MSDPRLLPVAVIGSGCAGLITAHTLLQDGFQHVQLLTKDASVGGVWCRERIYPGLTINNVHGEFRFSALPMTSPRDAEQTGGRLTGEDMNKYMQEFADRFLKDHIKLSTEVLHIRREDDQAPLPWKLRIRDKNGTEETLNFARIVLCTGGCNTPNIPSYLSQAAADSAQFKGLVFHSLKFKARVGEILEKPQDPEKSVLIVGCGKSAQDMAAYLASQGRKVTLVFETADSFIGGAKPLPDFLRKSRFLTVMTPHIELKSRIERFLHTTWLGKYIVSAFWNRSETFSAFGVAADSPLRKNHPLFWTCQLNDEGAPRDNSFFSFVNSGKIELVAPARVTGFTNDGVSLNDGRILNNINTVILATGYTSSWAGLFDKGTIDAIGLDRYPLPPSTDSSPEWPYTTFASPPSNPDLGEPEFSALYRGIIPARNLFKRDFAVNGAVFSTNNGYTHEVCAHYISSYFLRDPLRLPESVEEAFKDTARNARWMATRFPTARVNESYSGAICFLNWPQYVDELLEDMGLETNRSGGNWLTWLFKVMDLKEIENLSQEREARRQAVKAG
ncbi:FAD/NAD-P-binding domain-containing protein [Mycena floridula]|nr:FAD/NAD-P-binding domain-containing protein [Mycena floridula]